MNCCEESSCCEDFFKALSDPTRQNLLKFLEKKEMNVNELTKKLKSSQPNISHHLQTLKNKKLVLSERRGQEVYYKLNKNYFNKCCCTFLSMFNCFPKSSSKRTKETRCCDK